MTIHTNLRKYLHHDKVHDSLKMRVGNARPRNAIPAVH